MKAGERGELLTPTVHGKMLGCCFVVVGAARGWWMGDLGTGSGSGWQVVVVMVVVVCVLCWW